MENIAAMANWKYAHCPDCGMNIFRGQQRACCNSFSDHLRDLYVMRHRYRLVPMKVENIFGVKLGEVFQVITKTAYEPLFRNDMSFLIIKASQNINEIYRNVALAKVVLGILNKYTFTEFARNPEPLIRSALIELGMSDFIDEWKARNKEAAGIGAPMRVNLARAEQFRDEVLNNIRCGGARTTAESIVKPDYFVDYYALKTKFKFQNTTEETQMKTTVLVLDANRGLALSTTNETARSVLNGLELVNITRDANGDITQLQRADVNVLKSYVNLNIMDSETELAARAEEVREAKLQNITAKLAKLDEERAELTKLLKEVKADK